MTSEPITTLFPSPEKLSPFLSSNPINSPKKIKSSPTTPSKEEGKECAQSQENPSLDFPSFSKYINPQRLKPYDEMLKKNIRSFNVISKDGRINEESLEKCMKEKYNLDTPTIEINFKFTCDYELIECELKEFLELFGEINSLNYDMNSNSLKIIYKYYLSSMYANYYLNHLIYENKRKIKYENYLILTGQDEKEDADNKEKKISGPNEKQSEDIFKFIKFLTENYKNEPKMKLHETPIKSAENNSIKKLFETDVNDKKEEKCDEKNADCSSFEKNDINTEKKISSSNVNEPKNLVLQQNSESQVKKSNPFKNYSANNIMSKDKNDTNKKRDSAHLRSFNPPYKPPFLFMPFAPQMRFGITFPVIFPLTTPFLGKPYFDKKPNKNVKKEDKKGEKNISSNELKHDENKINSCLMDNSNNNPINSINDKNESDNSQSQNEKQIKEIFDNINSKIANISNNSNDSTNTNEKNINHNDNISNDVVNLDSINKSNSDLGSSNKNMSNKSDSTIKTEKVNKSNNTTTDELRRIIDIKNLEDVNMNKSFNSKEGKNKSSSSSGRNSDFMSSFKGKTLSLERLNNYLQENKPVSNFENPTLSLNLENEPMKDSLFFPIKGEEEKKKDENNDSKKETPSDSKKNNSKQNPFKNNNPMNNYFNPMYNFFYIPPPMPNDPHSNQKKMKMDYPPIPYPPYPYVPPMAPFPNFFNKNNPINFNKDVIDFNKLTLETKNKVHFMTHSSRNYYYKYVCNYTVQIENDNLFMVTKRIIGKNGCFLKKILQESCIKYGDYSTKIRLRGKGSGYVDKVNSENSEEPLMLSVSSLNYPTYYNCCLLLDNLMNKIYDDYYEHLHKILPKELHYSIIKKKLVKNEFVVDRVNSMPFNNFNNNNADEFHPKPNSNKKIGDNKNVENTHNDSK